MPVAEPLSLVCMASGWGSNVMAIHQAIVDKRLNARILGVISNQRDAGVIDRARQAGLSVSVIPHSDFASRADHESALLDAITALDPQLIVLAGYMRILSPAFVQAIQAPPRFRLINIHPALLPAFPGTHGYADAFNYGVTVSGVTVHFVDEGVDTGPIIAQQAFYRTSDDTLESFKEKGLTIEHQLYPAVLQAIANEQITVTTQPNNTYRVQCPLNVFTPSDTDGSRLLCHH